MGAQDNKALLKHVYEEISRGNRTPMEQALADDVTWTIIGTTVMSGVYRGKQEVIDKLFTRLRARLSTPIVFSIEGLIAEDDRVVLLAKGKATSHTGKPYNNSYCIVARVADGKFKELTDYIDTALINEALGT